ncbi:acetyl-CoA carboxylase biotin carboxyl carrier protein [Alkalicoccus daliensis]|uniref:Biotin carboxyl carrier protein of acetyl-CoA carboxylase n=1 Tax=Alkalicoccus daliensis TaxID=745820 RepID=A0A1H0B4V8_9BACI|nr:acetyl-CoA carboxylase biotin carboxyl carrier protein [Alkalicoccus daliensis]SDN40758.1 acetyl-CoA carboxylase biotin carboxyl carrier protein [Alkalicoccus daliensis]
MLKIQEIRELIKLIDDSSIDEFKYEQNGAKVSLKKNNGGETISVPQKQQPAVQAAQPEAPQETAAPAPQQTSPEAEPETDSPKEGHFTITSPMVGTFYSSPSPESDPYIQKGDKVSKDSVVCIVEAMKLMNEIEAEVKGEVVDILVENGQLVEYGQDLFLVKPE